MSANALPVGSSPVTLPVYLINLPKDSQRRNGMREELRKAGLLSAVVHCNAVYGKDLARAQVEAIYDEAANLSRHHKMLSLGEIGCYASHLECWKSIAASPAPSALVLEDDVTLDDRFTDAVSEILRSGITFDMVKLVGRHNESVLRSRSIGRTRLIRYFRVPSHTSAYLVSRAGAHKLLACRSRFFRPVDVDLRHWWEAGPDFALYGQQPYPTRHADLVSVLGMRPPSPHGAMRYRWIKFVGQFSYTVNLLKFSLRTALKPFV